MSIEMENIPGKIDEILSAIKNMIYKLKILSLQIMMMIIYILNL